MLLIDLGIWLLEQPKILIFQISYHDFALDFTQGQGKQCNFIVLLPYVDAELTKVTLDYLSSCFQLLILAYCEGQVHQLWHMLAPAVCTNSIFKPKP